MKDIHLKVIMAVFVFVFTAYGALWLKDVYRSESWLACIKNGFGDGTCSTYARLLNGEKQ